MGHVCVSGGYFVCSNIGTPIQLRLLVSYIFSSFCTIKVEQIDGAVPRMWHFFGFRGFEVFGFTLIFSDLLAPSTDDD